ncbi:MAG: hypothetical protein LBV55_00795 [Acholeplasmatales bacterium]|jgi:hypothetical protein|nr:hypothetical protein [Acholeplasmatales bacterium]
MKALYIIVNNGFSSDIVNLIKECGSRGATIISARGGASELNFFNVPIEPAKEIIITLVEDDVCNLIDAKLKANFGLDSDVNGLSYSIEVDSVNFINKFAHPKKVED